VEAGEGRKRWAEARGKGIVIGGPGTRVFRVPMHATETQRIFAANQGPVLFFLRNCCEIFSSGKRGAQWFKKFEKLEFEFICLCQTV
jgi:hypothetical protein